MLLGSFYSQHHKSLATTKTSSVKILRNMMPRLAPVSCVRCQLRLRWAGQERVSLQICGEKGPGARDTGTGDIKGSVTTRPFPLPRLAPAARCVQAEQVDRRASELSSSPAGTCTLCWPLDTRVVMPPELTSACAPWHQTRDSWPEPGYPRVGAGAGSRSPYTH